MRAARRAFYALCTHIDHQLRVVLGTLREQGILDNTVILFTSDHGDMLGKHGLWAKTLYYEESACVPMLLVGAGADSRVGHGVVDDRLVGWHDVMPTLLELAGIDVPASAQGLSMVGSPRRDFLYGEVGRGPLATRMLRDRRYKLIYYAAGNGVQLFDLLEDPEELVDLAAAPERAAERRALEQLLIKQLADEDEEWVVDGELVGLPAEEWQPQSNKGLTGQRGGHWPI